MSNDNINIHDQNKYNSLIKTCSNDENESDDTEQSEAIEQSEE